MRVYQRIQVGGREEQITSTFGYVSYDLIKRNTHTLAGAAAYAINPNNLTYGRGAEAELLNLGAASADFFPLLGVTPEVGRFFDALEDSPANPARVAVLGNNFWRHAFGGDRGVVGRTVVLSDESYTVIGVAPAGFTGPSFTRVDVWLPLSLRSTNVHRNWTRTWNAQWHRLVVRLKPNVSRSDADADITAAYRNGYGGDDKWEGQSQLFAAPLTADNQGKETAELSISRWLTGVAAVVLLIAVSNVVNLLLARAVRRRREVAVRLALGAGSRRLVRLLLTESVLLAILGGAAGVAVALLGGKTIRTVILPGIEWPASPVSLRVLLVTAAVALGVGIVAGLVPALKSSRPVLSNALKAGGREGETAQRMRLRAALTVAQAALSIVLLVGAGLFVKSLAQVRALDLGLQPERVLAISPRWPRTPAGDTAGARIARAHQKELLFEAQERLRSLPGIEKASQALGLSFQTSFSQYVRVPGWDSIPVVQGPYLSAVTEQFFETVGTPVLQGRAFTAADRAGSEPVAVVNGTMAKTLWPGRSPIGDCLYTGETRETATTCYRIVGVVADARRFQLKEEPAMQYFIPLGQERGFCCAVLLARPRGEPSAQEATLRDLMAKLDPTISYVSVRVMQELVDPQIRPWKLGATVFSLMGLLALVIAGLGLYSVLSYLVAQRTHELGVRLALGASGQRIIGMILRSSLGMAGLGVVIGLGLALWAGRFVQPLLFETSPRDPLVIGGVAVGLLAIAVLASMVPALRARRVNPMEALRAD
jgi:predicted permease